MTESCVLALLHSLKNNRIVWVLIITIFTFILWTQFSFDPQRTPQVLLLSKQEKIEEHLIIQPKLIQSSIEQSSTVQSSAIQSSTAQSNTVQFITEQSSIEQSSTVSHKPRLKYILLWTLKTRDPVKYLGEGKHAFITRNCSSVECYVSTDRNFLKNVSKFDVIVFHSSDIRDHDLPKFRSPHQKYVFASMESADYYPFCNTMYNDFFNWTWTYKLNSDEQYSYITIKDTNNAIIGPRETMHWKKIEEMDPIDNVLRKRLSRKKIAAAWFVSNCHSRSKRELFVLDLTTELQKYGLTLDTYGQCGTKSCPRYDMSRCWKMLEQDYYFYLSFENSFSQDYVTEKLLHALQHYTVPIVYGGANYTRFMPDGIYLDAITLSVSGLAKKMAELIHNKEEYYNYFRWHNHYSYHDSIDFSESDPYCNFCAMVNNDQRFEEISVYHDFRTWWSTSKRCESFK